MCFTISSRFPKPLVAKKDITCYKMVFEKGAWYTHKGYEAACQPYAYYPGRTTKKVVLEVIECTEEPHINEGYHSYRSLKIANEKERTWGNDMIVIKMVIPKGTTYYKNDTEYVSERIKCIGEL